MAEIIFEHLVQERGIAKQWKIDSAGTAAYHIGDSPDSRSISTCKQHYPDLKVKHRGRQISESDFYKFEYILCMDDSNLQDLQDIEPKDSTAILKQLGSFDPEGKINVKDPYYGEKEGFQENFKHIMRCCIAFLEEVK